MITPAEARASYRRALDRAGEEVTLRRGVAEHPARARVTGYEPEELVGDISQGDRKIILLADALPIAPKKNDQIVVRGVLMTIEDVDDSTRRVAGDLIAYEIRAVG